MRGKTSSPFFRALARRGAAFLAGLVFVLSLAELVLRLPGTGLIPRVLSTDEVPMIYGMSDPGPMRPGAYRILCAGNSHTQGAAEFPSGAFPAQLDELLREKYPGREFQVINAGLGNWNSSEVLENLPGFLARYRPQVVFAMIGEPNYWNYRFLPGRSAGWIADNLRRLKIVRFLDLLRRFDPKGQGESMPSATDPVPSASWIEYPLLATGWVAYLERHADFGEATPADLEVARSALERWTRNPLGATKRRALSTLAMIDFRMGRFDDALAASKQLLAVPKKRFDFFLWKTVLRARENWSASARRADFEAVLAELEGRVSNRDWLKRLDDARAPDAAGADAREFLKFAVAATPGDFRFAGALAGLYRRSGQGERIVPLYRAEFGENPGALWLDNGVLDAITPEERAAVMKSGLGAPLARIADMPDGAPGEGDSRIDPHLSSAAEQAAEMARVRSWEESDLQRLTRLVSDFGATLVLQTYPLYRKTLKERWPDPLIRSAAAFYGVPLSDTSRVFAALFRDHPSEEYYFKKNRPMQDDHLNTKGNRVVAELMLEKLEELGVLKKP